MTFGAANNSVIRAVILFQRGARRAEDVFARCSTCCNGNLYFEIALGYARVGLFSAEIRDLINANETGEKLARSAGVIVSTGARKNSGN